MKQARTAIVLFLRWLPVLAVCMLGQVHAQTDASVQQLLVERRFSEALSQIEARLTQQPGNPQLRFLKGVAENQLGRTDAALATFTQLTRDYPELPEPYNNLAVLHASQGRYAEARAALELAIQANPDYATAHENLGDIYIRLGEQAYARAQSVNSDSPVLTRKLTLTRELITRTLNPAP